MGTRTALFAQKQPGGVFDIQDLEKHPNDVWFVNSTGGIDSAGYGRNPDAPFATLDYAIGNCTASKGDVIYVMPGHAESFTATEGFDADVAGIKIIGLGWGAKSPNLHVCRYRRSSEYRSGFSVDRKSALHCWHLSSGSRGPERRHYRYGGQELRVRLLRYNRA